MHFEISLHHWGTVMMCDLYLFSNSVRDPNNLTEDFYIYHGYWSVENLGEVDKIDLSGFCVSQTLETIFGGIIFPFVL